jgi:hypothetical protein
VSEKERTPEEWAQERGVKLHGMTDERWNAYLRYLEGEGKDDLAEVSKRLLEEAKDLHAAWHAGGTPTSLLGRRKRSSAYGYYMACASCAEGA